MRPETMNVRMHMARRFIETFAHGLGAGVLSASPSLVRPPARHGPSEVLRARAGEQCASSSAVEVVGLAEEATGVAAGHAVLAYQSAAAAHFALRTPDLNVVVLRALT